MIPDFDSNKNLPPGIHTATIEGVRERFAHNEKRRELFAGLEKVVNILQEANCPEVFLDGSYITEKEEPNDYDLCYEPEGMTGTDPFRKFLSERDNRKAEYLGDIFVRMPEPPYYQDHVTDWQIDGRNDDVSKGILRIDLRGHDNAQK